MADQLTQLINRGAEFASNFKDANEGSEYQGHISQRRRFAEDLSEAKARNDERLRMEFEELQRKDPQLMNAVTARRKEGRLADEGAMRQDLNERKFERILNRDVTVDDLNERKFQLQEKASRLAAQKQFLDMEDAEAQMEAELIVQARERDIRMDPKTPPGSTAYQRAVLDLLIKNPEIKKDTRTTWLKQAGIEDPDAAVKAATEFVEANPGSRVSGIPLPGGARASIVSQRNELSDDKLSSEIVRMGSIKDRAIDEEVRGLADERLRELQAIKASRAGKTAQPASTAAPSTAPETPATLPTTVATVWRRNAEGTYRFEYDQDHKPTGKFEPIK